MKKLLFALPLLALAFVFVYCDRSQIQEEISASDQSAIAHERGTCTLTFSKASPTLVSICGTNLNANVCASCTGAKATGTDAIPVGVPSIVRTLTTPIELTFSSATGNTVSISDGVNPPVIVPVPAGCKRVHIDDLCNITVL